MNIGLKLERLYQSVISSEDKNFYLELKKYVEYLISERKIKKILKKLNKQFKKDSKDYNDYSKRLIIRFKEIKNFLDEKNTGNKPIKNLFNEFDNYLSKKITSTATIPESLFYLLQDIINLFKQNKKDIPPEIDKEIIDLMKKYTLIKNSFEMKRRVAEWYSLYFLKNLDLLDEDLSTNTNLNIESLGKGLIKGKIEKVIQGNNNLPQEERKEYQNHLDKIHRYILEELMEEKTIKNPLIWVSFLFILPVVLFIFLYNPFIRYDLSDNLIKQIGFDENLNKYTLLIDNLNESVIDNKLIVGFIEEFTRTSLNFQKYNLYFKDSSYVEFPKKAILKYNISLNDENFSIMYKEKKLIRESINFNEKYEIILIPQITFISDNEKREESFKFKPSYKFFIQKSSLESLIKFVIFYLVWVTLIIIPLHFVISKILKSIKPNID